MTRGGTRRPDDSDTIAASTGIPLANATANSTAASRANAPAYAGRYPARFRPSQLRMSSSADVSCTA